MTSTEPTVTAAMRPAVNPIAPAPISTAADQNSLRRPSVRSSRADDHARDHAPGRERRDVQTARRVAQVELVAQVHDDQPRRRLQIGEPGEHHVRDPGEPIPTELRPRSFNHESDQTPRWSDLQLGHRLEPGAASPIVWLSFDEYQQRHILEP